MRDSLVLPALGLAAGIASSRWLDLPAGQAVVALVAVSLLVALAVHSRYRYAVFAGVTAAGWCAGIWTEQRHRPGQPPKIEYEPGEVMTLEGCVVEPPLLFPGKERFVLELERGARVQVSFYLKESEVAPELHYGQRVTIDARLREPHDYRNPGSFGYVRYLARRDIYWTASANARSPVEILGECGNPYLATLLRARESALEGLDRTYPDDPYTSGMLRAILLGDVSRIEDIWVERFRRTGTYHALVISGLHITTLAACFLFFFRVLSFGPGWSLLFTSILGWTYAAAVGFSAPVLRAAAGITLYQLCAWFYRRPRVLNLLAAVAIGFLLLDPEQLFDASFQLTFLSVAMIAAIAGPWLDQTAEPYQRGSRAIQNTAWDRHLAPRAASFRIEMRLLAETFRYALRIPERFSLAAIGGSLRLALFFWNLFVLSAIVQIGLTLPMAAYFHRISLSGLTANLLIVPLMNAVVPLGFFTILTGWSHGAAVCAAFLRWSAAIAQWHAVREPEWRVPDPPVWLAALFIAALVAAGAAMLLERRWPLIPLAAAWTAIAVHPFAPVLPARMLEMSAIDVGQGDSIFLAAPTGQTMIVDTGGMVTFRGQKVTSRFDTGEEVVSPYLFTRSIRHVDIIALSHAHDDHIGGLKALVENFHPREIWTGAFPDLAAVRALGVPVRTPKAGEKIAWGGTTITILSPPRDYEPGQQARNNDSLAFRIDYGRRSFLLTGDVEKAMELRMASDGVLSHADVLKVAHHGSRTSTIPEFLDAVRPGYAVISDGIDNSFRHPHPVVLQRLKERGVTVWRTDRHGLVTFRTDGTRLEVEPYVR